MTDGCGIKLEYCVWPAIPGQMPALCDLTFCRATRTTAQMTANLHGDAEFLGGDVVARRYRRRWIQKKQSSDQHLLVINTTNNAGIPP